MDPAVTLTSGHISSGPRRALAPLCHIASALRTMELGMARDLETVYFNLDFQR